MATVEKTAHIHPKAGLGGKAGRFFLHLLEMLLAMGAGMAIFHLLEGLIPASSSIGRAAARGTDLHTILMLVFMTVPMVAWMVVRGHGWRHSLEMGAAMLAPMAAVIVLCQLGVDAYVPWLAQASCPAMYIGMLGYMVYRREHFTGQVHHHAHAEMA